MVRRSGRRRLDTALWLTLLSGLLAPLSHAIGDEFEASAAVPAQEQGLPFIRNFSNSDYGAHIQNWAIRQHPDGRMLFGNGAGVLEFDGARWRLTPVDNQTRVRSLAVDKDGRVHVGAVGEIGYLESDPHGETRYHSLTPRLPEEMQGFADVWRTFVIDDAVYFNTFTHLLRWDGESFRVWLPESSFHLAHKVHGRLFVRDRGHGLKELMDGELRAVPDGDRFAEEAIFSMLPLGDEGHILAITRGRGSFLFDGERFHPWPTEIDEQLERHLVYHANRLPDGRIAVGTLENGLYLLDEQGRWVGHVNEASGLAENPVVHIYPDDQGGLWLAAARGLSRVEVGNPLTRFDENSGLMGVVIAVHRHHGDLHASTDRGLFRLDPGPMATWHRIDGIQSQTWDLLTVGDALLVANYEGVYEVRNDQAELIRRSRDNSYSLLASSHVPGRVYIGLTHGLAAIRRENGGWRDEGRVPGIGDEVRYIHEGPDGQLLLGTENAGVIRVVLDATGRLDAPKTVEQFGTAQGLPELTQKYIYRIDGEWVVTTRDGLYRFDEDASHFSPDPRFKTLFGDEPHWISNVVAGPDGRIWMYASSLAGGRTSVGAAVPDPRLGLQWDDRPLAAIAGMNTLAILPEEDGIIWVGGVNGLFRYDSTLPRNYDRAFQAMVRGVRDAEGEPLAAVHDEKPTVDHARNRIRFEFAAPSFDGLDATRYQVRLEGQDDQWSPWFEEAFYDYANLWEGHYRFRVRARNLYGTLSEEADFEFRVLAPWYRTAWAWAGYILLFGGLIWGGVSWRLRRLEGQKRALKALVRQRTRQLEEATVTDQLTGLRNRRYLEQHFDIDVSRTLRHYRDWAADRTSGAPEEYDLLFFMMDIDRFKEVNDNYGHGAGDRVLEQTGAVLSETFRDADILVRWGGEEFLGIARFTPRDNAPALAERIRNAVEAHTFDIGDGQTLKLSCSIGFASFPFSQHDTEALDWSRVVDIADHCLYAAKNTGRNAWVGAYFVSDDDQRDLLRRLRKEPEMMSSAPGFRLVCSFDDERRLVWH